MDDCNQNRVNQIWYDELALGLHIICRRRNGIHFAKLEIWQIEYSEGDVGGGIPTVKI